MILGQRSIFENTVEVGGAELKGGMWSKESSIDMLYKKSYFKNLIFPSLGRAPMLVYVRPSNEALLRVRVPGAQRAIWSTCFPPYFRGPAGLFQ